MVSDLAHAHIHAQQRLRQIIAAAVATTWSDLGSYDRADVAPFVAAAAPLVLAGQRQSVALTDAFLARSVGRQPLGVNPDTIIGAAARNGVPPETVYARPFVTVWTALKDGASWRDAVAHGRERATSTAEMDVQLAMRGAVAAVTRADPQIVGYRRVPDASACTFCLLAATQRYHDGQLLPLHNRCGCGIEPITGTRDPGQSVDPDRLRQIKETGTELAVHDHGELGPLLTDASHDFTYERELAHA